MRLLSILALLGMLFGATAGARECSLPLKPALDGRYQKECTLVWPEQEGCSGQPVPVKLIPGKLIDRFVTQDRAANDNGRYFSLEGEAYSRRALPYVCQVMAYTVYQIRKPLTVAACEVAPWFGSAGGGTQYRADEGVQELLKSGIIAPVRWYQDAPCDE